MLKVAIPSDKPKHKRSIKNKDLSHSLDTPDTWETVWDFAKWWNDNGMPIMLPHNYEVFLSDDATSVPLFRKGQFQVEMYLIHPKPNLPVHEHPGVEVIKMRLNTYKEAGGKFQLCDQQVSSDTLMNGESHGAGINFKAKNDSPVDRGFPLLAFQKWDEGLEVTTVASRWKGKTVGPKQEGLIKRFKPNAFVKDGYANVNEEV